MRKQGRFQVTFGYVEPINGARINNSPKIPIPCQKYLSGYGCIYGKQCRYIHFEIRNPWKYVQTPKASSPFIIQTIFQHQTSKHLERFLEYFGYPQWVNLKQPCIYELLDLFPKFNGFDWEVLIKKIPVQCGQFTFQVNITQTCSDILYVFQQYQLRDLKLPKESRNLHNLWTNVLALLSKQRILNIDIIRRQFHSSSTHLQLFRIYLKAQSKDQDRRMPMIVPTQLPKTPLKPICHQNGAVLQSKMSTLSFNYEIFGNQFPSLKELQFLFSSNQQFIKLYADNIRFDRKPQIIEELILFYVWQDFYMNCVQEALDEVFFGEFDDVINKVLRQYILDESSFTKGKCFNGRLLSNKNWLFAFIKSLRNAWTLNAKQKKFWSNYLMNHPCQKCYVERNQ